MVKAALFSGDALWPSEWKEGLGEKTLKEKMGVSESELTIFSSWFCPFAQRVWIAAEEKEVNYKWVEVNPYEVDAEAPGGYSKKQLPLEIKEQMYPEFVKASPRGLVPAVECDDERLAESDPIIEYIDGKFPKKGATLCSSDPYLRAYCRIWADHANANIQRPYYRMLVEQSDEARVKAYEDLLEGIRKFTAAMAPLEEGPYFLGKDFSYTDVSFAPFFQRILWVGKAYRNIDLPKEDPAVKRILAWWDAVSKRKSVAKTLVSRDRLIASYSNYAENKATSDYAKSLMSSLSPTTRATSALTKKDSLLPVVFAAFIAGLAIGLLKKGL